MSGTLLTPLDALIIFDKNSQSTNRGIPKGDYYRLLFGLPVAPAKWQT